MKYDPFLSVIIPTYNRQQLLTECLQCFKYQSLDSSEYEVIIVNNNSTDYTESVAKIFMESNPHLPIRYEIEYKQGLNEARNKGLYTAKGHWVTYLDDDVLLEADYLENIVNTIKVFSYATGFGGKIIPKYRNRPNWVTTFIESAFFSKMDKGEKFGEYGKSRIFGIGGFPFGANMTYQKGYLKSIGGFKRGYGRHPDLGTSIGGCEKLVFDAAMDQNRSVVYAPNIKVQHQITEERYAPSYLVNVSLAIGRGERKRTAARGSLDLWMKGADVLVKQVGAILLYGYYYLIGQKEKGRYIKLFRDCVTKGFFNI